MSGELLRTGRKVGRTIYVQHGLAPSLDDPLIGIMDTPELAARVVEAVNAAAPVAREDTGEKCGRCGWFGGAHAEHCRWTQVTCRECGQTVRITHASGVPQVSDHLTSGGLCHGSGPAGDREDTASPDEAVQTVACPDCGVVAGVLDSIPSLSPVIDDHKWLGVLCSGSGTTLDRPAPAQPTEAPDVQRAAEDDGDEACMCGTDFTCLARHNTRGILAAQLDEALFFTAPDGTVVFRWMDGRVSKADEPLLDGLPFRMADVALGVLQGGGADGGGEDEDPNLAHRTAIDVTKLSGPGTRSLLLCAREGRVGGAATIGDSRLNASIVWAMLGNGGTPEDIHRSYPWCSVEDAAVLDQLRRDVVKHLDEDDGEPTQADVDDLRWESRIDRKVGELAEAAGIDCDGLDWEEVLDAGIAAIRAGREPEVVTGAEAAELPVGSLVVLAHSHRDVPLVHAQVIEIDGNKTVPSWRESRFLVLERAPAPTPAPLTVGDEVKTPEQLAALPEHTVLRDASYDVCERMHDRWKCFTGTDHIDLPARILDLPGGGEA